MQSVPKKIFQILDGTPAVYGQHTRGQSLVELALVTPLLIVLLMGLAEIGWFANNYLILLETTRVGARYGAVQTGDTSPYLWPNEGSVIPLLQPDTASFTKAQDYRVCSNLDLKPETRRFYNTLVCRMFDAMSPLAFRANDPSQPASPTNGNGVDDIVVSAFQLQTINPSDPNIPAAMRLPGVIDTVTGYPTNQQQVIVVGRYPTNANECTSEPASVTDRDLRDPFNYINYTVAGNTNGTRNYIVPSGADVEANRLYYENAGYDAGPEYQRGFAFTGQHVILSTLSNAAGTKCYGSEWTIDRVEQLMNVGNFSLNAAQRNNLPSQGLILVEMFWQHTLLLRNPVFNPVFNILNDPSNPNGNGTIISVWAAFPLPSIEPRIKYALGS